MQRVQVQSLVWEWVQVQSLVWEWVQVQSLVWEWVQVQSLVWELRSYMPRSQNIRQKQYFNKFNKDFKNGPHENNLKKETERDYVVC